VTVVSAGYYNENWGKNGHGEKMVTGKKWSQGKKNQGKNVHWEKKIGKKRVWENLSLNRKNAIFSSFLRFLAPRINFTKPLDVIFYEESNEHYIVS
jgi:hypothetical protein